jgi:hypothetical protein
MLEVAPSDASLRNQDWAWGQLHNPICPAADHTLVKFRMASRADDEQVRLELLRQLHNVSHRMPGEYVDSQVQTLFSGQAARTFENAFEAASRDFGRLLDLLDEVWEVRDLLDADHMELGLILFGKQQSQGKRVEGRLGAVIGMQDFREHRWAPED